MGWLRKLYRVWLRDYFAGQVIAGILANEKNHNETSCHGVEMAYHLADEMMLARDKDHPPLEASCSRSTEEFDKAVEQAVIRRQVRILEGMYNPAREQEKEQGP